MKKLSFLITAIMCLFLSSGCQETQNKAKTQIKATANESCCAGYTGPITNHLADSLSKKDNFMPKDTILAWTARYTANKKTIGSVDLPASNILGDSSSFNRCIIKAIICNDSCIGLRVVYGMSPDMKVHVILVGIKPDYSTLYIKRSEACFTKETAKTAKLNVSVSMSFQGTPPDPDEGGGEYGMQP